MGRRGKTSQEIEGHECGERQSVKRESREYKDGENETGG